MPIASEASYRIIISRRLLRWKLLAQPWVPNPLVPFVVNLKYGFFFSLLLLLIDFVALIYAYTLLYG
jgi:hypothetical protein